MAIYHFSGTVISRSQGKSSIASAAYRSGEKLYDERQERVADYSLKQDVVYKEIILPEGAPEWMVDREKLWNAVEAVESRKDAQLAREVHFSLPREFTKEQNIELAREFVQNEFVSCGMVADLCIHEGKAKDGEEQPHAHVMLTMREVMEDGFGLKERSWNAKENYMLWREEWAEHVNKYLALNGIDQRIDHRSYAEQGIDLIPQGKIGPKNLGDHEQRIEEHRRIAKENGDKILEDPSIALKAITYHQSTFTHQDLARFINRHTVDAKQFQMVYEKVKGSEQIIALSGELGAGRFTTKEMLGLEQTMLENAVELKKGGDNAFKSFKSDDRKLGCISLSLQQEGALKHIIGASGLKCLVGYAGTGKSVLLSQAREIWEKHGYRVHGATLSGIAAENLEAASGIESRTLASRCYYWDKGEEKLEQKDILVVDEAGMLGSRQMARVLEEAKADRAKVILIGDPQQLQAIEAGAAFRAIIERVGYFELTEVKRQKELWQQEATKEFALQNTRQALSRYEQHGCVHVFETQAVAKQALIEKWNNIYALNPDKRQIILAYTRRDVQELNEMARDCRKDRNELGEDMQLQAASGNKQFAINDRIYFLRNDRFLGVKNGSLGTIEKIYGKIITAKLDRDDQDGRARVVTFNLDQYNYIDHGYAATIYKAQAVTVDKSHVLASKHLDSHSAYVGMSRHREDVGLYWSKEEFADKKELGQVLSRDRSKDVTLDYLNSSTLSALTTSSFDSLVVEYQEISKMRKENEDRKEGVKQKTHEEQSKQKIDEKLAALGDFEAFQKKFEREHPKLAAKAQEEIISSKMLQSHREEMQVQRDKEHERERNEHKQRELAARQLKEQEKLREHRQAMLLQQEKTTKIENLVKDYRKFNDMYYTLRFAWNSRPRSIHEASEQMERCADEICRSKDALHYLQTHDKDLFREMNQRIKEQEKEHVIQEKQKGFELELTR